MNTRHLLISCWLTLCASLSGTVAPPITVTGTQGHSVSLPSGIPVGPDVKVEWNRVSPRNKIVTYSNGNINYFNNEQYRNRTTFHTGNASLEIHDLRTEDSGDYEVMVTSGSGAEYKTTVRLEVYAGTVAPSITVTGTQGHSVSLPSGIPVGPDVEVQWIRVSPSSKIVSYSNTNINYSSNEQYGNRTTFHTGNASLEIRELRTEDSGDYEVMVTSGSGAEIKIKVRLEVYEPVSGANIMVQNITGTCNLTLTCSVTSGNPTNFSWWRRGEVTGDNSSHHFWKHGKTIQIHCTAEIEDVVYGCEASNPISEDTAQVRLGNVCNPDTCIAAPKTTAVTGSTTGGTDTVTLLVVLSVVATLLIFALTTILMVTRRRRSEGREVTSGTEDQAETGIIYTDLQWMQKNHSVWQPPRGNDRFAGLEAVAETTPTEYAAVMYRASPSHGWAEDRAPGM